MATKALEQACDKTPVQGRCKQHGVVEGLDDRRGRLRCSIDHCRKLLAKRLSEPSPPGVRDAVATDVLPAGDLSLDLDVREHRKALALVNYQRAIREAQKPTAWEAELADLRASVDALATRLKGFENGLAIALQV